ncbi:MAG: MBL fold metallo-hydrolase [Deltaproteobacteria bacterium]|nr:MBL fold metallo-hydrolase [Deltaproteobacteria bacterium]
MTRFWHLSALLSLTVLLASPTLAQQDLTQVEIETVTVASGISMLVGAGGNIGVSYGEDGVILIDDQYAPLTAKIQAAVGKLSQEPTRFVLNTHWHGDHSGGNENLGKAGAVIVAHDNVRVRMSTDQLIEALEWEVPASPKGALPEVTFTENVTFHLNGDAIHAYHVEHAHTDGDAIVIFSKANVVHMGDIYFNGLYPFIDVSSGGSIDGMIEAVEGVLSKIDGETKIIPGHGPLSNQAELQSYLSMLKKTRANVAALIAAGKTVEEAIAAKPNAEFDESLSSFIDAEKYIRILYSDLAR